jgi:excinuclease UvrABC ATPase subunit
MSLLKAVIPVAGLGTRMLPATKAIPKEMLPLVDKPLIQYVVNECIAAGIKQIVLVTHSSKNSIENHFTHAQLQIATEILKEIRSRLSFMLDVGLNYLTLHRSARSLSGGEAQRIRLATQIGSELLNVIYVLDEPSIGLHQRDNTRLIRSLQKLRDTGNSVIVVEHDKEMIESADWVVKLDPAQENMAVKLFRLPNQTC